MYVKAVLTVIALLLAGQLLAMLREPRVWIQGGDVTVSTRSPLDVRLPKDHNAISVQTEGAIRAGAIPVKTVPVKAEGEGNAVTRPYEPPLSIEQSLMRMRLWGRE
jgi:hypothetical protein